MTATHEEECVIGRFADSEPNTGPDLPVQVCYQVGAVKSCVML